mgnify:FL=1
MRAGGDADARRRLRLPAEGRDAKTTPVSEVMSADPITVAPDVDTEEAARMMARFQVRWLPVVEDGRLLEIVVTAQLARRDLPAARAFADGALKTAQAYDWSARSWARRAAAEVSEAEGRIDEARRLLAEALGALPTACGFSIAETRTAYRDTAAQL